MTCPINSFGSSDAVTGIPMKEYYAKFSTTGIELHLQTEALDVHGLIPRLSLLSLLPSDPNRSIADVAFI